MNYKKLFPIFNKRKNLVYLDSAATSLTPACVIKEIERYYTMYNTNVHRGVYRLAYETNKLYEEGRALVASFINSSAEEVIFTKGTTDSLNIVALMLDKLINENDEIIISYHEHHSCLLPFMELTKRKKARLVYVPLDEDNKVTLENFKKVFTDKTRVVCLSHITNVLGIKEPIEEIGAFLKNKNVYFVVDGAQAAGHIKVDVKNINASFYAFSAHKMLGPTGVGVLYGKKELLLKLDPPFFGGDMNEDVQFDDFSVKLPPTKFEAGTPPIAEVLGFKKAIELINEVGVSYIHNEEISLKKKALSELLKIPEIEVYNNNLDSGIISFNIKGVHPHDVVSFYDTKNICIRAGHHCAQLITRHLDVLGTLRASFSFYNDLEDTEKFIETTKKAVHFFKVELGV